MFFIVILNLLVNEFLAMVNAYQEQALRIHSQHSNREHWWNEQIWVLAQGRGLRIIHAGGYVPPKIKQQRLEFIGFKQTSGRERKFDEDDTGASLVLLKSSKTQYIIYPLEKVKLSSLLKWLSTTSLYHLGLSSLKIWPEISYLIFCQIRFFEIRRSESPP